MTQQNKLRVIPLGGLEEVGRNMTVFEYNQEILIIDMGLQFPEEDMPGIDYIIPNIDYLRDKTKNIKGIIITHGHYDHIGAIPHLMADLGNPPIYTMPLTRGIILKRQEDFSGAPKLNIQLIKKDDKIKLGSFEISFFHVNHNIPDGFGTIIKTPEGIVVHTGDFKFDHSPIADQPVDIASIAELGKQNVLLLMSDSTGAESPGYSISEKTIQDNLEEIFKKASGRIIAVTFASLISRVQEIINLTEKYNRKLVIDGYSMRMNVEIAKELGYLKIKKFTRIKAKDAGNFPDSKVVIMATGAQGEGNAVLMRMVTREHQCLKIHPGDTVVFYSSVVPGNERTVQGLKDTLYRQGAKVVHYGMMDIHTGGHAHQEDLKMMINLVKPKYFMPIHGSHYMLRLHAELAESIGIPAKNIIISDNGQFIEFSKSNLQIAKDKAPTNYVMIDGLGVGDVGNVVLRDRQMMAQDGMFTIIVMIDSESGRLRKNPQIISRGFIYMKESQDLIDQTRAKIKEIVNKKTTPEGTLNPVYVQRALRDEIGEFLFRKTERRPMILPLVVEV
ncbi:MAG: ribonuclease J [bacterium]